MNTPVFRAAVKSRLAKTMSNLTNNDHDDDGQPDTMGSSRKKLAPTKTNSGKPPKSDARAEAIRRRLDRMRKEQTDISEANKNNF